MQGYPADMQAPGPQMMPRMGSLGSACRGFEGLPDNIMPRMGSLGLSSHSLVCLSEGSESDPDLKLGFDLSELALPEKICSGSAGEASKMIWWRQFSHSTSAIKVLVKTLHDDSLLQGYKTLLLQLSHPNLVKVFQITKQAPHIIVAEYCTGGRLCDILRDAPLQMSLPQRAKVLLDVAKALEYLHFFSPSPPLLHMELTSSHVFLSKTITKQSQVPLAKVDFGPHGVLVTKQAAERWFAPEVLNQGQFEQVDTSADVYSFGMLMFEVFSRQAASHVGSAAPDSQLVDEGCPKMLLQLMQDCLGMDARQRPSIVTVRQTLQKSLSGL